jgi:hypothetical protein
VIRRAAALAAVALLAAPGVALADGPQIGVSLFTDGVVTAKGGIRYVTVPLGNRTLLEAIRTDGGRVSWTRRLPGDWGTWLLTTQGDTGGIGADGRLLVLGRPPMRIPARRTDLLLFHTHRWRSEVVHLRGDFSFDAMSPDSSTLYLIQHVGGPFDSRYRVRAYDTNAHRLLPGVIAERWAGSTTMAGVPVQRVAGPGNAWEYTLYQAPDGSSAFVHALDTVHRFAMCIDISQDMAPDTGLVSMRLDGDRSLQLVASRHVVGSIGLADLKLHPATPRHRAGSTPPSSGGTAWAPVAAGLGGALLLAAGCAMAVRRRRRHALS